MKAKELIKTARALAFSFAYAIQQTALNIWQGKDVHMSAAQQDLVHRARCNRDASRGEYNAAMEEAMKHLELLHGR